MGARVSIFRTTPRIVMGPGAVAGVGAEAKALGATRVLVVTDPGIMGAGLLDPVEASLKAEGLDYVLFSEVSPDPRHETVEACLGGLGGDKPDCVIGLGGGSPIDIAKTVAVMLRNAGDISDYCGVDLVPNPGAPTIIIPTTAGTGSEVTPIAILSDEQEKLKKGVVSPHLMPRVALLDPELTVGLPPAITAATGMDALIHAIEAYTSVNATGMTDMLAARAIELISDNLRTAYARGSDLEARQAMMEGSLLAGIAFANAGVTAVHAFAYPIGAEFHIPHGIANTLMLAPVMRFNLVGNLLKFAEVAELMGQPVEGAALREAAEMAVDAVMELAEDLKVPQSLREYGIKEEDLPELAQGVMKVTRLLANNPRVMTAADAEEIYRQVL
ncbi:MAG: iron-containing alcohol dehydrogenase [Desulfarculaceae bacterium]|nr:iron-containing alcohol dehydrogenase [Desulfarculaceae bacterium]